MRGAAQMAAAAAREGRIFLTRDSRLAERRDIAAPYVLHSDDPTQQLGELVRHFGVRCVCMGAGVSGPT